MFGEKKIFFYDSYIPKTALSHLAPAPRSPGLPYSDSEQNPKGLFTVVFSFANTWQRSDNGHSAKAVDKWKSARSPSLRSFERGIY
jgi:hypothetical protein